jgi:hypothetical protein
LIQGSRKQPLIYDKAHLAYRTAVAEFHPFDFSGDCQSFIDNQSFLIKNPLKPVVQYAAFGKPPTTGQLDKMMKKQAAPPLKMN